MIMNTRNFMAALLLMVAGLQTAKAQRMIVTMADDSKIEYDILRVKDVVFAEDLYKYVDLGLPSGTLWATCNVGASSPEEYGDYFAWGDTIGYNDGKTDFTWNTYRWCNGMSDVLTKYCIQSQYGYLGFTDNKIELLPDDDPATVKWGGLWQSPSLMQLDELLDSNYTTEERTTLNDVNGMMITSKSNGNSIFLPAAGYRRNTSHNEVGTSGFYWSRSLFTTSTTNSNHAYGLAFRSNNSMSGGSPRYFGLNVRPVRVGASNEQTFAVNGVSFKMKKVKGGTFTMGATSEQSNGYAPEDNETPTHLVALSDYWIGETEVTQALWYAVMEAKPTSSNSWSTTYGLGDNYPAYWISWEDCQTFITKLNQLTGQAFRMPTEAEWEFAARGGNKSHGYVFSGSNTIDDVAWYYSNSGSSAHPVATKAPNELGIYDMSGNVIEWCQDWNGVYGSVSQTNPTGPSSGSDHVMRGGNWGSIATGCRVAKRGYGPPTGTRCYLGFRLAM